MFQLLLAVQFRGHVDFMVTRDLADPCSQWAGCARSPLLFVVFLALVIARKISRQRIELQQAVEFNLAQSTQGTATEAGTGIDLAALEDSMPSCRPRIIGARSNDDAVPGLDDETGMQDSQMSTSAACAVCLANLEEGEEARGLPCEHLFHRSCIDAWLSKSKQCPVCRQAVITSPATTFITASV